MPKPARSGGGSTARPRSLVRSCPAADGSCAGPRSGATADSLRLFLNSRHRLFSLDAQTGKPVPLVRQRRRRVCSPTACRGISDITHATQSSPPVVYRDLVIVGSQIPDRVQLPDPMGYVQAFDARTGKRVWNFSVIPQSAKDPGAETWENESWRKNGHANVWAPMTLDEARGLLYLPTSTPSSDYYGGERPGANLFAESLVCLDAATGKMKWHFQMVHHGLWDYDNPAQPNLVTITVERPADRRRGAGHQAGIHLRVRSRDRRAGLADRRAAGADRQRRAGEKPYPTQPFPSKPPAFVDQGVSLEDANDLTPEIKAMAQEQMQQVPHRPAVSRRPRSEARCSGRRRVAARTGAARRSIPRPAI